MRFELTPSKAGHHAAACTGGAAMGSVPRNDSTDRLLVLYEGMLVIRRAEERLHALFADGEVPGFIHLSIGQEAVPVGISASLGSEDTVASNHRDRQSTRMNSSH